MVVLQKESIVALISAGSGAVVGALITVFAEWGRTSIREAFAARRERRERVRQWWGDLRSAVHRFDLYWTPWAQEEHPISTIPSLGSPSFSRSSCASGMR